MSPKLRAPISKMQNFVSVLHSRIVIGTPKSLLNEDLGATVAPIMDNKCLDKSLVVVFP